jgi:hypothetical protein
LFVAALTLMEMESRKRTKRTDEVNSSLNFDFVQDQKIGFFYGFLGGK